ncbi:MAG: HAD family hydrolase [Defluviitaleaceae bacterium]|nr:HAD family hydrolase [Defluviitaleaceae bacterium]
MIKMIITDMDGTLLNSEKKSPIGIKNYIERLHERGVKFVIASGRQYYNLRTFFLGQDHMVSYISENGALIFENGKNIYAAKMEEKHLRDSIAKIKDIKGAYPIYCGIENAYIMDEESVFLSHAKMYYEHLKIISDISQIADDIICKIAVFDEIGAETNSYPILQMEEHMQVTLSGHNWVDITEKGVNKGHALSVLQKKHNLKPNECIAFGDYLNDCDMMALCEYSYAMANAHPDLKKICRYETASNDDDGVMDAMRLHFPDLV